MRRIAGANTIELSPGKNGFRGKDTVSGVPGTELHAQWFNDLQEEFCAFLEASGMALAAERVQLLKAERAQRLNVLTAGGTANAITLSVPAGVPAIDAALLEYMPIRFLPASANTGAVTLAVTGLAAAALQRADGSALKGGELQPGRLVEVWRVGAAFRFAHTLQGATVEKGSKFRMTISQGLLSSIPAVFKTGVVDRQTFADPATAWDGGTGELTIRGLDAGDWLISAYANCPGNDTTKVRIEFRKNGTTFAANDSSDTSLASGGIPNATGFEESFEDGDRISVTVMQQTSGGAGKTVTGTLSFRRFGR